MRKIFLFIVLIFPSALLAMADVSQPIVYGVPTLYGEYEITDSDVQKAGEMYGESNARVQPIRAGVDVKKTAVAKHPVKAKKVKKAAAKKAKAEQKAKKKIEKFSDKKPDMVVTMESKTPEEVEVKVEVPDVAPAADVVSAPVEEVVKPSPIATAIAAAAAENVVEVDSFCTQRKPLYKGALPDGLVLMPGRPDLMSCTTD